VFANVAASVVGGVAIIGEMARTGQAGTCSALPSLVFIGEFVLVL
jgi:hypothetical protein